MSPACVKTFCRHASYCGRKPAFRRQVAGFRRAFSVIEVVFSFAVFATAISLLMVVLGNSLAARRDASDRALLSEQLSSLVEQVSQVPVENLLDGDFVVPELCPGGAGGAAGTSCVNGLNEPIFWSVTPFNTVSGASDVLRVRIEASGVSSDGNIYRRFATVSNSGGLGEADTRKVRINLLGDTTNVRQIMLVDYDSPTSVVSTEVVSPGVKDVTFNVSEGFCTFDSPCRPALSADSTDFALSDRASLAPEAVFGASSRVIATRGAITEVAVETYTRTRLNFNYVSGLPAATTLCLELGFWQGETERFEDDFCDPSNSQVTIETYEPEGDGVEVGLPVGREIYVELSTGGPPPSYVGLQLASGSDLNLDISFDGSQVELEESSASAGYSDLPDAGQLSLTDVPVLQGSTEPILASVSSGGSPDAGVEVAFAVEAASGLIFPTGNSCTTDASGECSVDVEAKYASSGNHRVIASSSNGGFDGNDIEVQKAATSVVVMQTKTLPAGQSVTIPVAVVDGDDQAVEGEEVTVTVSGVVSSPATTGPSGLAVVEITVPGSATPGQTTVTVETASGLVEDFNFEVSARPDNVSVLSTTTPAAAGLVSLAIQVSDTTGVASAGAEVTLTADGGALTAPSVFTNSTGQAVVNVWFPEGSGSSNVSISTANTTTVVPVTR